MANLTHSTPEDFVDGLSDLIPVADTDPNAATAHDARAEMTLRASSEKRKATASELARLALDKKKKMSTLDRNSAEYEEAQKDLQVIEVLEQENLPNTRALVTSKLSDSDAARALRILNENTRPEIASLLNKLNINLNLALTKSDTMNLLAALLTCNEQQLQAIYDNPATPLVIKTVIKRLQLDLKNGDVYTIERLWDRIFGKADSATLQLPTQPLQSGILPNTPVSREAYLIIRESLIK